MMWPEIETYRQLEQKYELELKQFEQKELEYRGATSTAGAGQSTILTEKYKALEDARRQLIETHQELERKRSDLARLGDEAAQNAIP